MSTAPPDVDTAPPVSRRDAWLTRHGVVGTLRRDTLLTVVLVVAVAVGLPLVLLLTRAAGEPVMPAGDAALLVALTALQCLPLVVRRTHPVPCLLVVAAAQLAVLAVTPDDVAARGPASLVAAYTVATLLPARRAAAAVAAAVALEAVGSLLLTGARDAFGVGIAASANAAVTGVGAALLGAWVRTRRAYVDLVRQRAADAVAAQEARVRAAVTDERSRMARELHDVAAHHLSAMVVQATATARLVEKDPEATREGLLAIRAQGRRTLEDLRLLVGVLRDPATVEDGAPVPGLADLGSLVEEARSLGAEVRLESTGEPARLGPLADVAAYRLVQEALSNARQHAAGAPVLVAVVARPDQVVVTVAHGPAAGPPPAARATPGVGLVGMRERVQLAGGRLDAGGDGSGGWTVRAELPAAGPGEDDT